MALEGKSSLVKNLYVTDSRYLCKYTICHITNYPNLNLEQSDDCDANAPAPVYINSLMILKQSTNSNTHMLTLRWSFKAVKKVRLDSASILLETVGVC